ncbi:MAG: hypothetical protein LBJ74_03550 [Heliobacteriaceae bacterium]|nr:hypothetical protein [Heliobacteriaceae bacterium]
MKRFVIICLFMCFLFTGCSFDKLGFTDETYAVKFTPISYDSPEKFLSSVLKRHNELPRISYKILSDNHTWNMYRQSVKHRDEETLKPEPDYVSISLFDGKKQYRYDLPAPIRIVTKFEEDFVGLGQSSLFAGLYPEKNKKYKYKFGEKTRKYGYECRIIYLDDVKNPGNVKEACISERYSLPIYNNTAGPVVVTDIEVKADPLPDELFSPPHGWTVVNSLKMW